MRTVEVMEDKDVVEFKDGTLGKAVLVMGTTFWIRSKDTDTHAKYLQSDFQGSAEKKRWVEK